MEIVYKDEKKTTEDKKIDILPKNIRQIGEPDQKLRIYIEDFASTYLQKSQTYKPELTKVCMLYGREREKNGHPVLFIQSAARVELCGPELENGQREPDWKTTEGIRRKFFPEQKLLGWSVIAGTQGQLSSEQAKAIHRRHFTGTCQVLFWSDGTEQEEIFFTMGNGELTKINGYYIYYEENKAMQEYMILHNPTDADRVGEPEDRAVRDFRQAVEKKHKAGEKTAGQILRIAAAACVVLAIAGVFRIAGRQNLISVGEKAAETVKEQWDEKAVESTEKTADSQAEAAENGQAASEQPAADTQTADASVKTQASQTDTSFAKETDNIQEEEKTTVETTASADEEMQKEEAEKPREETEKRTDSQTETGEKTTEETATDSYRTYQVKTGDTISSISQRYYGSMTKVQEICALNHIEKQDLIYTGQILLLP